MTAEPSHSSTSNKSTGRTLRGLLGVAATAGTLTSPWWIPLTPLITKPLLGFLALAVLWSGAAIVLGRRPMRATVGAFIALVAAFGILTSRFVGPLTTPTFTSSPVDVAQLVDVSRFRSCAGGDFSGASPESPRVTESDRSMLHYLSLATTYGSGAEVPILAVADGTISGAHEYNDYDDSALANVGNFSGEVTLTIEPNALLGSWDIRYMHVHPILRVGSRVNAGDVIATAPPSDWPTVVMRSTGDPALNTEHPIQFNVEVEHHPLVPFGSQLASFVGLLSDDVERAYAAAGFSAADTIISRSERDAAPCAGNYNINPDADWVNGDEARRIVDQALGTSDAANGSGTRPDCTNELIDEVVTDSSGTWRCQRAADGALVWGPNG